MPACVSGQVQEKVPLPVSLQVPLCKHGSSMQGSTGSEQREPKLEGWGGRRGKNHAVLGSRFLTCIGVVYIKGLTTGIISC